MNTAALIIAAGLPMYGSVPAAMFQVGAVSTAQHMIASFEKAENTDIYLVTDEATRKLEKQLSFTGTMFIRSEGTVLDCAKQAIVSLPRHYDRVLLCPCDRPMVMPQSITKMLSTNGDIVSASYCGNESPFYLLSMEAAEAFCADTFCTDFPEAMSNLGYDKKTVELNEPGLFITPDKAVKNEELIKQHQSALTRPVLDISISAEQTIFELRLIKLMRLVNSLHSVRDACEMLGISYSIAWSLLNSAEEQLGYPIVRRNQGGRSGSGSVLTEKGQQLLEAYDTFESEIRLYSKGLFAEYFKGFF
ncbi:MAG: LysR family transcriptional regulator [Oscillospiraceae bacterium]|nr:LysR family transcriptional regulator [Oscillospiraceae bacterium]